MKKIKMALTAVVLLGIVSTGLAFKAKTVGLFCDNGLANHLCNMHVPGIELGGTTPRKCVQVSQNETCPTVNTMPE
jgi:hypothetical protein